MRTSDQLFAARKPRPAGTRVATLDVDKTWEAATEIERRVLIDEFIEGTTVLSDHLDVRVHEGNLYPICFPFRIRRWRCSPAFRTGLRGLRQQSLQRAHEKGCSDDPDSRWSSLRRTQGRSRLAHPMAFPLQFVELASNLGPPSATSDRASVTGSFLCNPHCRLQGSSVSAYIRCTPLRFEISQADCSASRWVLIRGPQRTVALRNP